MREKGELEAVHCCGTCLWYNGEIGDGDQFCDDKEVMVRDSASACCRWKEKY